MADEYVHPDVFDNGLNEVKNGTNILIHLVDGFVKTDDLAAVQGKSLANATLTSGEMLLENVTDGRQLRIQGGKSIGDATGTSGATPDLGWAIVDGTRVLLVADSVSSEQITTGNPITMSTDTTFPGSFA